MKRILTVLALAAFAATPVAGQWAGMPVWNNPKGGTGITVNGDLGMPNQDARKGTAFGARGSVGLGTLTLTAGLSSWEPEGLNERTTGLGATAAFRVIGGSLLPVSVNLQAGAGTSGKISSGTGSGLPKTTTVIGAVGLSGSVPMPGLNIEPYVSAGIRYYKYTDLVGTGLPAGFDDTQSNVGFTIGANVGLGLLGLHLAYDSEKFDDGSTHGVFGIGAHVALKAPIGM